MFASSGIVSGTLVQLLLGVFGGGGLIGAFIALFKLKPDAATANVAQAQGIMEMMKSVTDELRAELSLRASDLEVCRAKCGEQEQLIRQMREMLHGNAMWDHDDYRDH